MTFQTDWDFLSNPDAMQQNRDRERFRIVKSWVGASASSRFIYGRNFIGAQVEKIFPSLGCFVEAELDSTTRNDLSGNLIMSVVMGISPISALKRASTITREVADVFSLVYFEDLRILSNDFIRSMDDEVSQNLNWYIEFYGLLSDQESRDTLTSILGFRRYWDLWHLKNFSDRRSHQYLEPFLKFDSDYTLFDVGAFTGDSYLAIEKYYGGIKDAFLFEPNNSNLELASSILKEDKRVNLLPHALSDFSGEANFRSEETSSRLETGGDEVVKVARLDDLDLPGPGFIKIDIEGQEEQFLAGSAETISKHRPTIAIAVYHRPPQMRNVALILNELLPNSEFYLRHYTEGFTETILYVVPQGSI